MLSNIDKKIILISLLSFILALYNISNLSISYKESIIVFNSSSFTHYFVNFFLNFFSYNDYALRIPFLVLHIINIYLLYDISKNFLKKEEDSILLIALYAFTPAIYSTSILVNPATIIISCTLLFIKSYISKNEIFQILLLILFLFIDNSFILLYLALSCYFLITKNNKMAFLSMFLFLLSSYIYGFDSGGKPKGHFLDTILIYSLIFSPFMFFAIFYSIYRNMIKDTKNIIWYISAIPFYASIIISFRQKILFEDFAPFVVISLILVVKYYYFSKRVRLEVFQNRIKGVYYFIFITLFFVTFIIISNKFLFLALENPNKHFLYKYYVAKELAKELKDNNINSIYISNEKLACRLRFYGINSSRTIKLTNIIDKSSKKISISYYGKVVKNFYITKI
jgi:hypothetical protein